MEQNKERDVLFQNLVNAVFYYQKQVEDLKVDVEVLDAQMIAIGNLMIKKGIVTKEEIGNYTDGVMKMKLSEKRREMNVGFMGVPLLKSEVEEMLSTNSINITPNIGDV